MSHCNLLTVNDEEAQPQNATTTTPLSSKGLSLSVLTLKQKLTKQSQLNHFLTVSGAREQSSSAERLCLFVLELEQKH